MRYKSKLAILALSTTCLVPFGALAADDFDVGAAEVKKEAPTYLSFVEGGFGYLTESSPHFGRFSGLDDKGLFFVGNASVIQRTDNLNFRLDASNVGTDARAVRVEGGRQGKFGAFLSYEGIPALKFTDTQTPFNGTNYLSLPTGWVPGATAQAMAAQVTAALHDVTIGQERQRYGGGATWQISPEWSLSGKVRREIKEGNKTFGLVFGSQGGTRWSAVVPEPVDYVTETADVALNYNTRKLQVQFGYEVSLFDNVDPHLTAENPFTLTAAASGNNGGVATVQLPPDNSAHLMRLAAGYNLSDTTRLHANFAYGFHFQDDEFLPYSTNPAFVATVPLPRDSLDGEVRNTLAEVGFVTRPMTQLDLRGSFRYFDRDNQTPQDLYNYALVDAATQGGNATAQARYNHPYSFTQYKAKLDAGYRLTPSTRLNVGYEYEDFERTHSEREENQTHTGKLGVRTRLANNLFGSVGYERSKRTGSTYDGMHPLEEGHHADYVAAQAGVATFGPHPGMRKYFEADLTRDKVKGSLSFMPTQAVSIGLSGNYRKDDYTETEKGLTGAPSWTATADISYSPTNAFTLSAFYSYDQSKIEQNGHHSAALIVNPDAWFEYDIKDVGHTAGIAANWDIVKDVFKLGMQYTYSRYTSKMDLTTGPATPAEGGLPENETKLHTVGLTGDYSIAPDIVLRLGYLFQKYDTTDWAYDTLGATSILRTIAMDESWDDYNAHVFTTAVRMKF
ncbi:MAG: MtrB/PioB family decaheme-associated outer membrane protein [Rhodospirillales bacterium]|nr:MtrB/PioB family decaheme-associated outer membrane protein [Rhodospirillales bacterium]